MIKVMLVLVAMPFAGEPTIIQIDQPSIQDCAKEAARVLEAYKDKVGTVKYIAAACAINKEAPERQASN